MSKKQGNPNPSFPKPAPPPGPQELFEMTDGGVYGKVKVPQEIFDAIDPKYLISHSTDKVKFLVLIMLKRLIYNLWASLRTGPNATGIKST